MRRKSSVACQNQYKHLEQTKTKSVTVFTLLNIAVPSPATLAQQAANKALCCPAMPQTRPDSPVCVDPCTYLHMCLYVYEVHCITPCSRIPEDGVQHPEPGQGLLLLPFCTAGNKTNINHMCRTAYRISCAQPRCTEYFKKCCRDTGESRPKANDDLCETQSDKTYIAIRRTP